ncbi:MAG TPA: type I methionyl aminopeptidase [Candidatus Saccharimonadales bacterium]|nr:type I methionyl aminopeptidase [Candidatus Saccharimonadales bacterium]
MVNSFTKVKTKGEVEAMRASGRILASILASLARQVEPGMSTLDLAIIAKKELSSAGGEPAFLGYMGFPDVLCVSLNDEIVHGIPRKNRLIESGDILSLDFGVKFKGMITDSAISLIVGKPNDPKDQKLVEQTKQALMAGIKVIKDGITVGDISNAIETVLNSNHYGIIRDMVGHGVGHQLHELPNIPNFGRPGSGPRLMRGMTIAIEPMATLGDYHILTDADHWTTRTADGSLSAHFEHTVLITEDSFEILTKINGNLE